MIGVHAIKNGKLVFAEDATVPVTLREVQYGFCTYESLRVLGGQVVKLDQHLERLRSSCSKICLEHPFSYPAIAEWVHLLIEADSIGDATMQIRVYGGKRPFCFVLAYPILSYPDSYYTDGVAAYSYPGERLMPEAKSGNLLLNYMAKEYAARKGGFEAVLVDRTGRVLEGTRSNFYAFRDGKLYTAGDEDVLKGVTRTSVLHFCREMGIEVVFQAPLIEDIHKGLYDEAFISATSMAAMPLNRIDSVHFSCFTRTLEISKAVRQAELAR